MSTTQIVSIVDDDEEFRLATASLVRSLGCEARVFASAGEFLQSPHIGETACLISDVLMPGMSGVDMHDRLLALGCAPPTIFITALLNSTVKAKIQAKIQTNCALCVFEKPVNAAAIGQCLSFVLGEP